MITFDEVTRMLRALLRWWWVIVLAVALSSGTAFYFSRRETRYYVARSTLMIGNAFESKLPEEGQLAIGSSLARFYMELARRERILQPVAENLKLPFPWEVIGDGMLRMQVVSSANLLEIYVTDSNPERAAAIANAIGEQLISYSPTSPDKVASERQAVDLQLKDADARIKQIKQRIAEETQRQQQVSSALDLAQSNNTLDQLNTSLAQEQKTFNSLLFYQNNSVVNSLDFFEHATPPTFAEPSKRKVVIGVAGMAGLLIALAAVFVLDRLAYGWRSGRDVEVRFSMDDLGSLPIGPPMLVAPATFVEERFQATRNAQTNILLAAAEQGMRTLMISSPQPSESRAGFSIDLADLFARSGHRVLIVDADFTSSTLTGMLAAQGTAQNWAVTSGDNQQIDIWAHLRPTPISNVALLPGRAGMPGTPAMIPSLRWRELVQHLLGVADVIIFDGPAALSGPDAALLAPHVDGVVLTLDPAVDKRDDVANSKARLLRQNGSRLLGALTFKPAARSGGSILRQLRGQKLPQLLAAGAPAPLVTPAPSVAQDDVVILPAATSVPLVTPAPEQAPDAAQET
jgi:Mrp family chromosome partitioning ATPase/capsular polysaccharide biosynthesis protein